MSDCSLTVKQVAERLGIRMAGVRSLIQSGELPAVDVSLTQGGRPRWRILPDHVEGFLTRRTHRPVAPRRRRRKPKNVKQYF